MGGNFSGTVKAYRSRKKEGIVFENFVEEIYLTKARARKKSWHVDERIFIQHIFPFFEGRPFKSIQRDDIEYWLESLPQKGLAHSTCNRILAVMKTICNMAEVYGFCRVSPCKSVKGFKVYTQRDKYLSPEQIRILLKELEDSDKLEALALRLILLTGARKNEILKAKWENVSIENRIIVVPVSKSGRTGRILLSEAAIEVVTSIPHNGRYLFPSRRNNEKPMTDIYYFWDSIRKKLNLPGVRIHDLRHTYASVLVNNGYSLYVAQKLLRHSSPVTTMRYAHLNNTTLLEAADYAGFTMLPGTCNINSGLEASDGFCGTSLGDRKMERDKQCVKNVFIQVEQTNLMDSLKEISAYIDIPIEQIARKILESLMAGIQSMFNEKNRTLKSWRFKSWLKKDL